MALEKEFNWYLANQDELVKKYNGRFLVIVEEDVVGDYESHEQAYFVSLEKYILGSFLIQECSEGDEAYTIKYYSPRVGFA